MKTMRARRRSGLTLVEMMLVVAMLGILTAAMSSLIAAAQHGYASFEAANGIQVAGQTAVNKLMIELQQSKRLIDRGSDPGWLAAAQTSGIPTGGPAPLSGTQLPLIESNGSFAPTTPSFVAASAGNELFFISADTPTSTVVFNGAGSTQAVVIDGYRFNLYYLAADTSPGSGGFGGQSRIVLQEWHSVGYADYGELNDLASDPTLEANAAAAMYAQGYHGAIDTSQALAANAFYALSSGGSLTPATSPSIALASTRQMIRMPTGVSGFGYRYGVSPNSGAAFPIPYPVPAFATAAGSFPSGFETMIVGANSARQVLVHLVLVAGGAFPGVKVNPQTVTVTTRDLY